MFKSKKSDVLVRRLIFNWSGLETWNFLCVSTSTSWFAFPVTSFTAEPAMDLLQSRAGPSRLQAGLTTRNKHRSPSGPYWTQICAGNLRESLCSASNWIHDVVYHNMVLVHQWTEQNRTYCGTSAEYSKTSASSTSVPPQHLHSCFKLN